jgi:MAC/Perforin domain
MNQNVNEENGSSTSETLTDALTQIPNLANYVQNAFNAKTGNFLANPVFSITYSNGNIVNWNDTEITIPDQISAHNSTNLFQNSSSLLLEDQADYDEQYSASINAQYSGVTYSGSLQSSIMYHGNLFTQSNSFYALNSYVQVLLTFERLNSSPPVLTEAFTTALGSLPSTINSPSDIQSYFTFFDNYGTHYLSYGCMGGTVIMETTILESILQNATQTEVAAAIQAGYNAVVNSGNLSVSTAFSSNEFLSQNQESIVIALSVIGGTYSTDGSIANWIQSCYNTPDIIFKQPNISSPPIILEPISLLTTNTSIIANINTLLPEYLTQDISLDGLISSAQGTSTNAVYKAADSDGFIISTLTGGDGTRSYMQQFNDVSDNPIITRACASQHYYINGNIFIPTSSCTTPIPKNSYYNSTFTSTSGSPGVTNQFLGLGDMAETLFNWLVNNSPK